MMTRGTLVGAYVAFAALAGGVNLASQWLVVTTALHFGLQRNTALFPALAVGTAAGLLVKYILDKRFIFQDRSYGVAAHTKRFSLYTVMGLVTTAIFWGTEYAASRIDPTGHLIYLGGALGLAIGYFVKFHLDRRFVFDPAHAAGGSRAT